MSITSTATNYVGHACTYTANIFTLSGNMTNCSASTKFLQNIFGTPIDVLTGNASMNTPVTNLVTKFLGHFDALALSLLLLIFSYVVFHGFLSTVNEGKFGGRDMGHWSYSLRAILPGAMLVPIKGGFCAMQFVIMYFILVGVNLANYVWQQSIGDINFGYTPTTPQAVTGTVADDLAQDFVVKTVFNVAKSHNFNNQTIKMGSISVWDSPYAAQAKTQLTQACNSLDPANNTGQDYDGLCNTDLQQMEKYGLNSIIAPMGGANAGESTQSPFATVSIGLTNNGMLNLGGSFKVANTLNNPDASQYYKDAMTALESPAAAASASTAVTCGENGTGNSCSFDSAIQTIENDLIANNPPQDNGQLTKVVVGTGNTCKASCRTNKGVPIPGVKSSQSCTLSSVPSGTVATGVHWTQQCYVKSNQGSTGTSGSKATYDAIPAQLIGNSWWYGSRVYLQLNKAMANNIINLANAVSQLQIPKGTLGTYTAPSTAPSMNYVIDGKNKTFTHSAGDNTGLSVTMASDNGKTLKKDQAFNFNSSKASSNDDQSLNSLSWNKMINCYSAYLPTGESPQSCMQKALGNKASPNTITVGGASADKKGASYSKTGFPASLENELANIPTQYQNPLKLLMIMNLAPTGLTTASDTAGAVTPVTNPEFTQYINNIVTVLKYNHVYPGSSSGGQTGVSSTGETTPVNNWINLIFNKLMGQNLVGQKTGDNNGIFAQIYSLGNVDVSNMSNVMNASFNTMAQAQRIGLNMIDTVTSALQKTYNHINSQLKQDSTTDMAIAGTGAGASIISGFFGPIGGAVSSAAATVAQTTLQFTMAHQMLSIGKEMAWMPIAVMVLTAMFTAGISFAVILPMTPFFLFWAGEMAWVLGVVEAMIAAPLLSLGFITPGGHQHFGHGVPGLKMLMSVVFRPVLMVLGLLCGMVLTYLIIAFSSQGFQLIASQILQFAGSNAGAGGTGALANSQVPLAQGIVACILLFTFCSFIMMAFTKCFSCIYVIPEKVMQWIGGMADKAGQQELQQMTQGMTQSAQQGAQAGGSSTEKSIGASQQNTQSQGQAGGAMISGASNTGQATGRATAKPDEAKPSGLQG